MKIVAIRPLELAGPEEYALVEPSEALMANKKISTGKALIPGMACATRDSDYQLIESKAVGGS
jgi:hypothetical protein